MPLNVSILNSYTNQVSDNAWTYCSDFQLNAKTKTGRIEYEVYSSKSVAYSGGLPLKTMVIPIYPYAQPAQLGSPELISPYQPPVYETQGEGEEAVTVEVSPEVPAVYGEAPVIRPAIPSFDELIASNWQAYAAITDALDNLVLDVLPEFEGGQIEQVGPV